jgi:hypothetical protein
MVLRLLRCTIWIPQRHRRRLSLPFHNSTSQPLFRHRVYTTLNDKRSYRNVRHRKASYRKYFHKKYSRRQRDPRRRCLSTCMKVLYYHNDMVPVLLPGREDRVQDDRTYGKNGRTILPSCKYHHKSEASQAWEVGGQRPLRRNTW